MSTNIEVCHKILCDYGFVLRPEGFFKNFTKKEDCRTVEVRLQSLQENYVCVFLGWYMKVGKHEVSKYLDLSFRDMPPSQAIARALILTGILPDLTLELLDATN